MGWRQIDIFAEEVVRRSPAWKCTITGGELEPECDALLQWQFHEGMIQNEACIPVWCFSPLDGYNGDG
jgi:hypothetical protein